MLCIHCASESTLSRPESDTCRGSRPGSGTHRHRGASSPAFVGVAGGATATLPGRKVGIVDDPFADDVGDIVSKSVSGVTVLSGELRVTYWLLTDTTV